MNRLESGRYREHRTRLYRPTPRTRIAPAREVQPVTLEQLLYRPD